LAKPCPITPLALQKPVKPKKTFMPISISTRTCSKARERERERERESELVGKKLFCGGT
jgi:hypothetical protein